MRRSDAEPLHEGLNLVAGRNLSALRIGDDPEWVSWIRASYLVVPEKSILRGGNRELLALCRDDFARSVGFAERKLAKSRADTKPERVVGVSLTRSRRLA